MPAYSEEPKSIPRILWDHFWLVLSITMAILILGLGITFMAKPVWQASATIVFPSKIPSILGPNGMTEQSSLAASLTGGPTPLKVYKGFLESERTLKLVSEEVGMRRKEVFLSRQILDQSMESSLTISARSLIPDQAKEIVAAHLKALAAINTEINEPFYLDDAKVLGKKLTEQRSKVDQIEKQLLSFQQSAVTAPSVAASGTGRDSAISPNPSRWQELQRQLEINIQKVNANIKAVRRQVRLSGKSGDLPSNLPPVRKWRDRLVELEYELKIKELSFGPEAPEIIQLKDSVYETRRNLEDEIAAYSGAIDSGALDPTASDSSLAGLVTERFGLEAQLQAVQKLARLAPSESISLTRLTRELAMQSSILQQVQAQFELAKIQEMRNPNRWQVLDEPEVAEEPVNKSFGKAGVLFGMAGLIVGLIAAMIVDGRKPRIPAEDDKSFLKRAA